MKRQRKRTLKRRRLKGKTDYKTRLNLLKSLLPRIVVRKTNRYLIAQYIKSEDAQDKVIIGANSKELLKYGWSKEAEGSLKSIPACYLTGLLLGKKIKNKEKDKIKVILDIGLQRNIAKGRLYSVIKGLTDSGIDIKHKKDIFPDDKKIKGENLKNKINFDEIKNKLM